MAGTKTGFTALQADFKIPGVPLDLLKQALVEGHTAKRKIINIMSNVINGPRYSVVFDAYVGFTLGVDCISETILGFYFSNKEGNMPILETFEVPIHKRNKLLGPAWMNIKKLFLQTGVQVCRWIHSDTASLKITYLVHPLMVI